MSSHVDRRQSCCADSGAGAARCSADDADDRPRRRRVAKQRDDARRARSAATRRLAPTSAAAPAASRSAATAARTAARTPAWRCQQRPPMPGAAQPRDAPARAPWLRAAPRAATAHATGNTTQRSHRLDPGLGLKQPADVRPAEARDEPRVDFAADDRATQRVEPADRATTRARAAAAASDEPAACRAAPPRARRASGAPRADEHRGVHGRRPRQPAMARTQQRRRASVNAFDSGVLRKHQYRPQQRRRPARATPRADANARRIIARASAGTVTVTVCGSDEALTSGTYIGAICAGTARNSPDEIAFTR